MCTYLITSRSKFLKNFIASTIAIPYNEMVDLDNKHYNMGDRVDKEGKIYLFLLDYTIVFL